MGARGNASSAACKGQQVQESQKDLERDAWARKYIEWYDSRNEPKTREQRDQLKAKIIRDALDQGEIRTDPAIPAVQDAAESLEDLMLSPIRAIQEEIAQADAYARADAERQMAEIQARDEANGYYEQDIQQQLDNDMLDDFPEPNEPEPLPEPEGEPSYQLPADVAKSKPRYGLGTVVFGNDFDRAAYIIRSKSKKSKGEDRIIASLEEQGFDVAAVRKHGEWVKSAIGKKVEELTGSRRAPQESIKIELDPVPFEPDRKSQPLMSIEGDRFLGLINEKTYRFDDFREARGGGERHCSTCRWQRHQHQNLENQAERDCHPERARRRWQAKGYSAGEYDWDQIWFRCTR